MKLWAEVWTPARVKQGLVDLFSAEVVSTLDQIGTVKIAVSPTDENAVNLISEGKRIHVYTRRDQYAPKMLIGQGVVKRKRLKEDAGSTQVTWEGPDALEDLWQPNTGSGKTYYDAPFEEAIDDLLSVVGWRTVIDSGLGTVSQRFDFKNIWTATSSLAQKKGVHVRSGRRVNEIQVGAFGDRVLRTVKAGTAPTELRHNVEVAIIEGIEIIEDGMNIVNKIIPLGGVGGGGSAALTLRHSTRSSPYTIQSEVEPDGSIIYFLEDATSVATWGRIERTFTLQDVIPVEISKLGVRNASNLLYDAAAVELTRRKDSHRSYKLTVGKLDKRVLPGDKIHVSYKGYVWKKSYWDTTQNATPTKVDYVDIHDEFWVLSVRHRVDASGVSTDLEVSDVDISSVDGVAMVAGSVAAMRDTQAGVMLNTQALAATHLLNVSPNVDDRFTFQFKPDTWGVAKALLKISRNDILGPDTVDVVVDGIAVEGGPWLAGSADGLRATVDISDAILDADSGIEISEPHTVVVGCNGQFGELVAELDVVEVLATVQQIEGAINMYIVKPGLNRDRWIPIRETSTAYQQLAMSFTAEQTGRLHKIPVLLRRIGDNIFNHTLTFTLYDDDSDEPDVLLEVIGTFSTQLVSEGDDGRWEEIVSGVKTLLTEGTTYWIIMSISSAADSATDWIEWGAFDTPLLDGLKVSWELDDNALLSDKVVFWKLDELAGQRIDQIGSNDLAPSGTLTADSGPLGAATHFASAANLSIADNADLSQTGNFTWWGWFRLDDDSVSCYMVSKFDFVNQNSYGLGYNQGAQRWWFWVSAAGAGVVSVAANTFGAVSEGEWVFIAAWHDDTNNLIGISVNGQTDTAAHATGVFNGTASFRLGVSFDGAMQGVGMAARVLPAFELDWLYNAGMGRRLEEYSGSGTRIEIVNGHDLTAAGNVLTTAAPDGIGALFDASDFLTVNDHADFSASGDLTLAAWIRIDNTANSFVVGQWNFVSQNSYMLFLLGGYWYFEVSNDGTAPTGVQSSSFGAVNAGDWLSVVGWHDATNDIIGIQVNLIANTAAHATGVHNSTAAFVMGNGGAPGAIWRARYWNRVLTTAERAMLYRGGLGLSYPGMGGYIGHGMKAWNGAAWSALYADANFEVIGQRVS